MLYQTEEDKYVVLLSGLHIGSGSSNPLQFQLLIDHITGHLGDEEVQNLFLFLFDMLMYKIVSHLICVHLTGTRYCSSNSSCANCWKFY